MKNPYVADLGLSVVESRVLKGVLDKKKEGGGRSLIIRGRFFERRGMKGKNAPRYAVVSGISLQSSEKCQG